MKKNEYTIENFRGQHKKKFRLNNNNNKLSKAAIKHIKRYCYFGATFWGPAADQARKEFGQT